MSLTDMLKTIEEATTVISALSRSNERHRERIRWLEHDLAEKEERINELEGELFQAQYRNRDSD